MNITVSKTSLLRLLKRCASIADSRSTMPVLANVLLEATGSKLTTSATDLYLGFTGSTPAKVASPGSIAVGARGLLERIKMMPDGDITIAVDQSATTIKVSGHSRRYTIHGIPGEEFPALPELKAGDTEATIGVDTLAMLIAMTSFSISTDETRLHLNSAYFECEGGKLRMVSTDGHRLSVAELSYEGPAFQPMLIPLKGVTELKRLCDETEETEMLLTRVGGTLFCELGGDRFSVKLTDSAFPPYQSVIPETHTRTAVVNRVAIVDSLKAMAVAASDRTGQVVLRLDAGRLHLKGESPDAGEGNDEIETDYSGADFSIGVNANYLLAALGAIAAESVALELSDELDPIKVRASDGGSYLGVVMPQRAS